MNAQSNIIPRGACLQPTATTLLGKPLEFIHEDHLRERQICTMLDEIASDKIASPESVNAVLRFLVNELPLHLMDEEQDLFPLLRRRCEPEDEISKVIARLLSDHLHAADDTPPVIAVLEGLQQDMRALTGEKRIMLQDFASHARRHLILENAVILPFARLRLTERDLETLHIRMCQRRGINHLTEISDAE